MFLAAPLRGAVLLNEISFDNPSGTPDWVELFNAGTAPVSLDGWVLTDEDTASGNEIHLAVSTPLPVGAFLTVMVDAVGTDDTDFSDGTGRVYSGTATTVSLAATEDEVSLYRGLPLTSATLVDFVAWVTDGDYGGAADQAEALAAGIWVSGGAVSLTLDPDATGYSIGRRGDGEDADRPSDFQLFWTPTPGTANAPSLSPAVDSLSVDPRTRAFSPWDPDPAYRSVRIFYSVSSPSALKTIRVYDRRGRKVRTLMEQDGEPSGIDHSGRSSGGLDWDGRDDNGEWAPGGVYVVFLEAVDGGGSTQRGRAAVAVGRP